MILTLLAAILSLFTSKPVNIDDGLIAYYPFSGNSNDVINNNNPVVNTTTLTADRFGTPGNACHFNGFDSYIQIPNSPTLNSGTQFSLCAWIKVSGFYYGKCHSNRAIMKGDRDYQDGNYTLAFDESLFSRTDCDAPLKDSVHQNFRGVATPSAKIGLFIEKERWYATVFTFDGNTSRFYLNGVLQYETPFNGHFSNNDDLYFGRLNNDNYPYWFKGDLDEVMLYNRPLSENEVIAYSNACLPVFVSGQKTSNDTKAQPIVSAKNKSLFK